MGRPRKMAPDARAQEIIALRRSGATLEEIGARYGVTRERVRQICRRWIPDEAEALRRWDRCGTPRTPPVEKTCAHCRRPFTVEFRFRHALLAQLSKPAMPGQWPQAWR
jgi:hypothetical protein